LIAAIEPVAERLMRRFKDAHARWVMATERNDEAAATEATAEKEALMLFKTDMATFGHAYTFLSQIFDYGNTDIEKRAIFYKVLLPLLDFGREREGIDLSKVRLTHHNLKGLGAQAMPLAGGEYPKLAPLTESGTGAVQEKQRAYLAEIIEKVNDLFQGELTDQDKLVYVNDVLKGKLLESATLKEQAINNTKQQFANSPDLKAELMKAIMGALDAHNAMSSQALGSEAVRDGLKEVLLDHAGLYEALRDTSPRAAS
jgi:type I restriction enzyme R subunit